MNLYINTIAIVGGFLTPFAALGLVVFLGVVISDAIEGWKKNQERRLEQERKAPPYDDIMFSQPPNPTMITVRLIKNGNPVWEESYDKGDFR